MYQKEKNIQTNEDNTGGKKQNAPAAKHNRRNPAYLRLPPRMIFKIGFIFECI